MFRWRPRDISFASCTPWLYASSYSLRICAIRPVVDRAASSVRQMNTHTHRKLNIQQSSYAMAVPYAECYWCPPVWGRAARPAAMSRCSCSIGRCNRSLRELRPVGRQEIRPNPVINTIMVVLGGATYFSPATVPVNRGPSSPCWWGLPVRRCRHLCVFQLVGGHLVPTGRYTGDGRELTGHFHRVVERVPRRFVGHSDDKGSGYVSISNGVVGVV